MVTRAGDIVRVGRLPFTTGLGRGSWCAPASTVDVAGVVAGPATVRAFMAASSRSSAFFCAYKFGCGFSTLSFGRLVTNSFRMPTVRRPEATFGGCRRTLTLWQPANRAASPVHGGKLTFVAYQIGRARCRWGRTRGADDGAAINCHWAGARQLVRAGQRVRRCRGGCRTGADRGSHSNEFMSECRSGIFPLGVCFKFGVGGTAWSGVGVC